MAVLAVLVLSRIAAAFAEHGGSLTDVEVREDGLYAMHALPAGSRIATSPYELAVTPQTCLNDPSSDFSKLDPAVVSRWTQTHGKALLAACLLKKNNYLVDRHAEDLPLVHMIRGDLNESLAGSQALLELERSLKEVSRFHDLLTESGVYAPWEDLVRSYAFVNAASVEVNGAPTVVPVVTLMGRGEAVADVVKEDSNIVVVLRRAVSAGDAITLPSSLHRAAFFAQYGRYNAALPSQLDVTFHLRPADSDYEKKKHRFPEHLVTAKQLYKDLADYLPAPKRRASLASALSFPHTISMNCDTPPDVALPFLRFVVADYADVSGCTGSPPNCPFVNEKTEKLAIRRLQLSLKEARQRYMDFAAPKVDGDAGQLLDDERACMDRLLADIGAPRPLVVGLYSLLTAVAALSAFAIWRSQRALWFK